MAHRYAMGRLVSLLLLAGILIAPSQPPILPIQKSSCAIALTNKLDDPSEKAGALVEIAKLHLKAGEQDQADKLLFEALRWVAETSDGLFRAGRLGDVIAIGSREHAEQAVEIGRATPGSDGTWALRQLIGALAKFELVDQANQLLSEGISRTNARNKTQTWYGDQDYELALLLGDSARAGLVDRALKVARGIKNPFVRANVLEPAAIRLAQDQQCGRAVRVARSIHYEIERIDVLVEVANICTGTGDKVKAEAALSYALAETRKDIFEEEQDTKTKALVSISLAYEKLGKRTAALTILRRAEKLAYTIAKPGFRDSGLSKVALAYAQYGLVDDALRVTSRIPSPSDIKSNTLAGIGSYLFAAGNRDRAIVVLAQAEQVAKDIDCTYFKYDMSARSCFGNKVSDFLKIAAVYEENRVFDKEVDMLDFAVLNNQYKARPPHQTIEDGSHVIGNDAVGEIDILKGYLAAGEFDKAIKVAAAISDPKERVVAIATIEFKIGNNSVAQELLRSKLEC